MLEKLFCEVIVASLGSLRASENPLHMRYFILVELPVLLRTANSGTMMQRNDEGDGVRRWVTSSASVKHTYTQKKVNKYLRSNTYTIAPAETSTPFVPTFDLAMGHADTQRDGDDTGPTIIMSVGAVRRLLGQCISGRGVFVATFFGSIHVVVVSVINVAAAFCLVDFICG